MALVRYPQSGDGHSWLSFWCPGCNSPHAIRFINAPPPPPKEPVIWCYDGNPITPTIAPSLRVFAIDGKESACHVVITNGILNYQADCKHALAGKSVAMQHFPKEWEE